MTPPLYLKQRKGIWYVQVPVPKAKQKTAGLGPVLERSLRTRDEALALRLRHAVIAEFQERIQQAVEAPPPDSAQAILAAAQELREAVEAGELSPTDAEASLDDSVARFLHNAAQEKGTDDKGSPRLPDATVSTIRRAHKAVSGDLKLTLAYQREAYLKEAKARLTAQTLGDKSKRMDAFAKWFGEDRACAEVTRKAAGRYVAERIVAREQKTGHAARVPISATTVKKEISDLRAWFDWLLVRGLVDANPFDRMAATVRESSRGKSGARRPWSPDELSTVLRGVDPNDPIWPLTVIAAYTGMRREEVADLRVSSVDGNVLKVEEGKTAAAVRRVPIHPALSPLVSRLTETSTDGYLISGLLRGGPDSKRGWYVGKRFAYTIRDLGVTDPALDFHALRGTFITLLEGAGVPESTIQLIVGHKRQGMTLGTYSAGVPDKVKREAIERLTYGEPLDSYVAQTGAQVLVKPSAKPRRKRAPQAP